MAFPELIMDVFIYGTEPCVAPLVPIIANPSLLLNVVLELMPKDCKATRPLFYRYFAPSQLMALKLQTLKLVNFIIRVVFLNWWIRD